MSERIEFKTNIPTCVTLAFAEGRTVKSNFGGGTQTMFSSVDGKVAFVPGYVGAKIAALKPVPGSMIQIMKAERAGKKGFDWKVELLGEQANGTYRIPKADSPSSPTDSEASALVSQCQTTAISGQSSTLIPIRKPATEVESHCFRLVDLTAETIRYASKHGGLVTRDDARAIAITVYIQAGKSGMLKRRPVGRVASGADVRRAG